MAKIRHCRFRSHTSCLSKGHLALPPAQRAMPPGRARRGDEASPVGDVSAGDIVDSENAVMLGFQDNAVVLVDGNPRQQLLLASEGLMLAQKTLSGFGTRSHGS